MIVINPITTLNLGLFAKKHWKIVLTVFLLLLFMPIMAIIAIFPMAKPEYVDDYKAIADDLGTNWVDVLIIDTIKRDNDFKDIKYEEILYSNLDFMQLKVRVYKYKKVKQEDGSYDWEWVYQRTNTYRNSKQILGFLAGYDVSTSKGVMKAINTIDNTDQYDVEIIYKDTIDMFSSFNEEQVEWAYFLISSNGIQHMYGEYVELPEFIEVTTKGFFAHPTPTINRITSAFGNRTDPISGKPAFHRGIDLSNGPSSRGEPIIASADGIVEQVSYSNGSYGYFVKMKHTDKDGNTWYTRYAHMNQINVEQGDKLKQGDVLGGVGKTGYSTGFHLHFEIYFGTQLVNPVDFIDK